MQKIVFIVNPFSGTTKKDIFPDLVKSVLDPNLYKYQVIYTEYAGHALEIAGQCLRDDTDIICAVGGDGTVNEVATPLIGYDKPLAIVPTGSGNGLARHLGISTDVIKGLRYLNNAKRITIDTCTVNGKKFVNLSGIGYDAKVAFLTKHNKKRGFFPYFLTSLKGAFNHHPSRLKVSTETQSFEGEYIMAVVANGPRYGYNITVAPKASLQDGMLDVTLVKNAHFLHYIISSIRFVTKTLHKSSLTVHFKTKELIIKPLKDDYYHIDGEGYTLSKDDIIRYHIVPASLSVLVPS